jgi:glycosyltransferase involved in cell wall biosynthesis
MKLLVITQKADKNDPVLGFFHRWVGEFSKRFDLITLICLEEGAHDLPKNVRVFSLGKETGRSKIKYIFNFYRHIVSMRGEYDAVFVHMNQEYVLLGGIFWKLFGKRVYMWRNHHKGSEFTDMSALFCTKIFCTSRYSYTAKYKKTVLMPVGIDTEVFRDKKVGRVHRSILFLARMAPVKKPHLLIEALSALKSRGTSFSVSFYGDPLPKDKVYYDSLMTRTTELSLSSSVSFHPGVSNAATVALYSSHEIFMNLSSSGMYDKTIFEAMSCGTLILASNENLRGTIDDRFIFTDSNVKELSEKLEALLALSDEEKTSLGRELRTVVEKNHSLAMLGEQLAKEIND